MSIKPDTTTTALLIVLTALVATAVFVILPFVILPITIQLLEAQADTIDDRLTKYPLGKYVSTSDEYNRVFNESFSGHIISQSDSVECQVVEFKRRRR